MCHTQPHHAAPVRTTSAASIAHGHWMPMALQCWQAFADARCAMKFYLEVKICSEKETAAIRDNHVESRSFYTWFCSIERKSIPGLPATNTNQEGQVEVSCAVFILFKDSMRRTWRTLKNNAGQGRLSQSSHKLKSIYKRGRITHVLRRSSFPSPPT